MLRVPRGRPIDYLVYAAMMRMSGDRLHGLAVRLILLGNLVRTIHGSVSKFVVATL